MEMLYAGIDVSKDRLDVHLVPGGEAFAVPRNGEGLGELCRRLREREPALIAVAGEAARTAVQEGTIPDTLDARAFYALELRAVVALAVGTAIVLGVVRILKGWPLHYLIIGGYVLALCMTSFAPDEIIGIAYDAGGVTTSTITVPLVTALGVGLASSIRGRNPALDGFGLIAFASLTPMIFVLAFGMVV